MILRGAIVGEDIRALEDWLALQPTPPSGELQRIPISAVATVATSRALAQTYAALGDAPEIVQADAQTFEVHEVSAWIDRQDDATRLQLAAPLAADIEYLRDESRRAGFAEGVATGLAQAKEQEQQKLAVIDGLAEQLAETLRSETTRLSESCVDLVAEIFVKLAGRALCTPEASAAVVLEVLRRVKDESTFTVKVCADDLPVLEAQQERIAAALAGRSFKLVGDSRVEFGGCIVEAQTGNFDGRLELQLRELFETLAAAKALRMEMR